MRPHENLDVWRKSVDFVVQLYKGTEGFPKDERFGLTSQMRRAAISIPSNIAEGAARDSDKEFSFFLSNAQGSASEVETQILIAQKLGHLSLEQETILRRRIEDVSRIIIGLQRSVRRRAN